MMEVTEQEGNIISKEFVIDDVILLNNMIKVDEFIVFHINIRGLQTNFSYLEILIENLLYKPDIIVCSDTRRLPCHTFYNLNDYVMYYNHGNINRADGCVIYIKDSLVEVPNIEIIDNFNYINTIIKLKNNVSIKVTSLYRCHKVKKSDFISIIKNIIDKEKYTPNHIIVGDFNINIMDTSNKLVNEYLNNYFEAGYIPLFNKITRPTSLDKQQGSCIDNMLFKSSITNNKTIDYKSIIINQTFPDYFPIVSSFKIKTVSKLNQNNVTYLNKKILIKNISLTNWNSILNIHDPELSTQELI